MLLGNFQDLSGTESNTIQESVHVSHAYSENSIPKTLKVSSLANPSAGETKFTTRLIPESGSYVLFSTRDNDNISHRLPESSEPSGEWIISVKEVSLSNDSSLGAIIDDILVIVTTEGTVVCLPAK